MKLNIIFNFKEGKLSSKYITSISESFKHLSEFLNIYYYNVNSFNEIDYDKFYRRWNIYLSEA